MDSCGHVCGGCVHSCVGNHCLWVLVVDGGVVVGDGGAVVVVVPCHPGVLVLMVLKVAVNMAHT